MASVLWLTLLDSCDTSHGHQSQTHRQEHHATGGFKGPGNWGYEKKGAGLILLWQIFLEELDFDTYLEGGGSCRLEKRN